MFRSTCRLFQIAYEGDFWSLCDLTFWQKVDFLISDTRKNSRLYSRSCADHFTGQQFVKLYLCVTKWRRTVCLSRESALHVCLYFSTQKFLCLKSWCSVAIRFFATSSLVCSSRFTPWLTRTLTREKIDILGTPCLLYWFFIPNLYIPIERKY